MTWVVAAAVTAGRGFDITDEGFYLLSYRWWDTELRTFTGAQFVYGPIFELLGHDIARLRLVRLATVIGANATFGWAFMRWLRLRRPTAPATHWWEAAGTAAIVACGGMSYSWLPLSPGYNDVSLLGTLLAAAVLLRMASDVKQRRRLPAWVPLSLGPVAFAMLISKWASSALTLITVAIVALIVLAPLGVRQIARVTLNSLTGFLITAVACHFFLIRLDEVIPPMLSTNQLVAAGANNPSGLALMYLVTLGDLIHRMASSHAALLITVIGAHMFRDRVTSRVAEVLAVAAAGISVMVLLAEGGFTGGSDNIRIFSVGLVLMLAVTGIVSLGDLLTTRRHFSVTSCPHSERLRGCAVVFLLLALPLTQAAGTGNPIYYMAFNAFSVWVALMIFVLTGLGGSRSATRGIAACATAGAVLVSTAVSASALVFHPYRSSPPGESTTVAGNLPALSSVRLSTETASDMSRLRHVVEPHLTPGGGTYMMAFDGFPGVVFALNGRSVGEAWYSDMDTTRTAAGIRATCPDGKGPWGSHLPILLFNRPISRTDVAALKACGLQFESDYRQVVDYHTQRMDFTIYVASTQPSAHGVENNDRGLE